MLIDRLKVRIAIVSVVLGALFATSFMAQSQSDAENSSSALNKQVTTGESCVKDTSWMRRNHMELLKHDRDRTLRQGIRPVDGSIKECVNCHATKDDHGQQLSINAEGEFCAGCHNFASVSIDCFDCHSTKPEESVVGTRR
jgi:predicted CXXCH cytochrome family protein